MRNILHVRSKDLPTSRLATTVADSKALVLDCAEHTIHKTGGWRGRNQMPFDCSMYFVVAGLGIEGGKKKKINNWEPHKEFNAGLVEGCSLPFSYAAKKYCS